MAIELNVLRCRGGCETRSVEWPAKKKEISPRMPEEDKGYLTVTWPDDAQGTSKCSVCGVCSHVVLLLKHLALMERVRGGMALQHA